MRSIACAAFASTALCGTASLATANAAPFTPGDLIVSRVIYSTAQNSSGNPLQIGDALPIAGGSCRVPGW